MSFKFSLAQNKPNAFVHEIASNLIALCEEIKYKAPTIIPQV